MKIDKSLKNFNAPTLDNSESWMFDLLNILPQTTACNHFSNENNLFNILINPCWNEVNDVFMFETLDEFYFWPYSNSIIFRQSVEIYDVPSNFSSGFIINSFVNYFVSSSAKFFTKALESALWRYFNNNACLALSWLFIIVFLLFFLIRLWWRLNILLGFRLGLCLFLLFIQIILRMSLRYRISLDIISINAILLILGGHHRTLLILLLGIIFKLLMLAYFKISRFRLGLFVFRTCATWWTRLKFFPIFHHYLLQLLLFNRVGIRLILFLDKSFQNLVVNFTTVENIFWSFREGGRLCQLRG